MVTGSSVGTSVANDPSIAPYLPAYAIDGLKQTFPPPPNPVETSYAAAEANARRHRLKVRRFRRHHKVEVQTSGKAVPCWSRRSWQPGKRLRASCIRT